MNNKLYFILLFLVATTFHSLMTFAQAPTFAANSGYPVGTAAQGVVYGNSKYVAVTSKGMVYTSTDGEIWGPSANIGQTINHIAYGNNTFVVVGADGFISSSLDGISWVTRISGAMGRLNKIEFIQGKFFAIGIDRTLLTSSDGISWAPILLNGGAANDELMSITYGSGKYLVGFRKAGFGDNYIYKSSTGSSNDWTVQAVGYGSINQLQYLKDRFWMFTSNTKIFTSPNGDNWSEITSSTVQLPNGSTTVLGSPNQMFRGIYDGTNVYFFGYSSFNNYGTIIKSSDGTNFTLLPKTAYIVSGGAAYLNGKYFQWGNEGIASSTDGAVYKYPGGNYLGLASNGAAFVGVGTVGSEGVIFKSNDFSAFTNVTPTAQNALSAVVHNGSKFLAVGDRTIVESADGNNWTTVAPSADNFNTLSYGSSKFVATGYNVSSSAPKIAYSTTGETWTTANSDNNYYFKVKYLNNRFFALGQANITPYPKGVIYTSTDGISWSNVTPSDLSFEVYYYNDVVWDGAKYHFMGMEYEGIPTDYVVSFFSISSDNPTLPTSYSSKVVITNQPTGVTLGGTYGEGTFQYVGGQLVGAVNDINNNRAYIIYSSPGSGWTSIPTDLYSGFYSSIIESSKVRFLGAGDAKLTVQVGPTAPSVSSIVRASANPTNAAFGNYTVTFSDNVTGVDASDFTLTSTGITGASISGVSGSGKTYTVSVNTGSGSGTHRLDFTGTTGVTPNVSGSYTSGEVYTVDKTAPTLAITSNVSSLKIGETATITFTFSEDPGASFAADDIVILGGTLSALSGTGTTRTATFTPAANTDGGTVSITVASGKYTDAAGNLGGAGTTPSITFDTKAPAAPSTPDLAAGSDSGASNTDNLTNDTTPTFTGTAEAGSTVNLYDGATNIGSTTADVSGNWTITSSTLGAGVHSIAAVATDPAGNSGVASAAIAVTIDTSAPTLAITSNRSTLKAGETATITFTFSEDPWATFTWNGSLGDIAVSGGTLSAISGTGTVRSATFTPSADTDGGSVSITVTAGSYADAAGNSGGPGTTPSITFDTKAPAAPSTPDLAGGRDSGASNTDNITNITTLTFSGTAEAGSTVAVYDGNGDVIGTGTATGGSWAITVAGLVAGSHNITALATDAAGNTSPASGALALVIDTSAPTAPSVPDLASASDSGVSNADNLTNNTTPTFTGTAESGSTVSLYDGATNIGTATAVGGVWAITSSALNAGTHSITAKATDLAGNTSVASSSLAITIDTSAPTLAITSDKASLKAGETAVITFTFSEDPGNTFTAGDIAVSGGTVSAISGTGTTRTATFTPDADTNSGTANITVAAGSYTDAAGNNGGAGVTPAITFDTSAPTLAISSSTSSLKIGETATITFTFSEDPATTFTVADISVTGGTLTSLSGTGTTRTATFTPTADTNNGTASITVAAGSYIDAAGNGGKGGTLNIIFDTKAPAAPVVIAVANGATVYTDKPTLSGTAEPNSTLTIYIDGSSVSSSVSVNGSGSWSHTLLSGLANGVHAVVATATDAAGNVGVASTTNTFMVINDPTIITSGTLTALSSTYGSSSAGSTSFSVSAYNLTEGILVTPPAGFEVSSDNSTFSNTLTLGSSGSVSGTVYVRLKAGAGAGSYSGNISLTSSGANSKTIATTASLVNKKAVTASAQPVTKVYDGNANATINFNAFTAADGLVDTDDVAVSYTSATFNDKTVNTGKAITITGIALSGADAANYSLNSFSTTGTITAKTITASAQPVTKVYDGNADATINFDAFTEADGLVASDDVTVAYTSATYNDKTANTGKTITINGLTLNGDDAANYSLNPFTTTGTITAKAITATAQPVTKVYDGSTDATLSFNTLTASHGLVGSDDVAVIYTSATYNDKTVNTGKAITISGLSLSGADAANYSLNPFSTTGTVTAKAISASAQPVTKVYDGDADATINFNTVTATDGLVGTDDVRISYTSATYNDKNVNTGKAITITGLALSGADAANYSLNPFSTTGAITKAPLIITADNKEKFQGLALPVFTASYAGFVNGEDHTVLTTQPSFSTTADAMSAQGDYAITISGATAANYAITFVPGVLTVKPGYPTSISLAATALYENAPAGAVAGSLSSTSDDPSATFSYTLVGGADKDRFEIAGNQIKTKAAFNYEAQATYDIVVRSTTQHGLSLDQAFTIHLLDVNEIPTLDAIGNSTICYTPAQQTIALSGISAGEGRGQTVVVSESAGQPALFSQLIVSGNELRYRLKEGAAGTSLVTLTVTDNGDTDNGGINTFSRSFTLRVNSLPVIGIASDKGEEISKGLEAPLTATGGVSYRWSNAHGILEGQNTATLKVRPAQTTTYRVRVTSAEGCESEQEFTLKVKDNYTVLVGNNIMSPNGDGVNDKFKIENIDMYPNNTVKIYDRGGRLLYSKVNYTDDWDGTFNGSPLQEDTYFYIVDFGPGVTPIRGFITIVRE